MGSAELRYTIMAWVVFFAPFGLFWWVLDWSVLIAYFLSINIAAIILYGYDKKIAGSAVLRVPENVLHGIAFIGGSPGAMIAQHGFRHKTAKRSFLLVYWAIVIVQAVVIVTVLM